MQLTTEAKVLPDDEKLLRKPEVADRLGVSPRTIETYLKLQKLPCLRIGRTVRFSWRDILEHLKKS
jgi:excisionase family DNA binding protein